VPSMLAIINELILHSLSDAHVSKLTALAATSASKTVLAEILLTATTFGFAIKKLLYYPNTIAIAIALPVVALASNCVCIAEVTPFE